MSDAMTSAAAQAAHAQIATDHPVAEPLPAVTTALQDPSTGTSPRSFKVEVLEENSTVWSSDEIRLATKDEAQIYAGALCEWRRVAEWRMTGTNDPVSHRQFENGELIELSEVAEYEHDSVHDGAY